ncbi:MAG: HAD-IA family hydrolase [Deinococcales bacterium]
MTSVSFGYRKPHASIFSYVLEQLSLQPDEAIMIGDSWEKDVLGAYGAGLRAVLFQAAALAPLDLSPEDSPFAVIAEDAAELRRLLS